MTVATAIFIELFIVFLRFAVKRNSENTVMKAMCIHMILALYIAISPLLGFFMENLLVYNTMYVMNHSVVRQKINKMDYRALEEKLYLAKHLFYVNDVRKTVSISGFIP